MLTYTAPYPHTEPMARQLFQGQNQLTRANVHFGVQAGGGSAYGQWCISLDQAQKCLAVQIHLPNNQEVKKELGQGPVLPWEACPP